MSEADEEKRKRWAKNAHMAYMTPAMAHAMQMSKYQSQNKYKEQFNKTKGKGFTVVTSTPEIEHAKKQSIRISQNKYKSDFEKNKAKFTQVPDNPEQLRLKRVTNQVSKVAYEGKGSALAESRRRKETSSTGKKNGETEKPKKYIEEDNEDQVNDKQKSMPATSEISNQDNKGDQHADFTLSKDESDEKIREATQYDDHSETKEAYDVAADADAEENFHDKDNGDVSPKYSSYTEEPVAEYKYDDDNEKQQDIQEEPEEHYVQDDALKGDEAANEEEVTEITGGGLDDFYANLG